MTQALNFTANAADALTQLAGRLDGRDAFGLKWLVSIMKAAQVFILPDDGELLARDKPRPEVPGLIFKPPFPAVAIEYVVRRPIHGSGEFTAAKSTKRIALAWDWTEEKPCFGPGVGIASICYFDDEQMWVPVGAGYHISYDGPWQLPTDTQFSKEAILSGRITRSPGSKVPPAAVFPLLPGMLKRISAQGRDLMSCIQSDLLDEANAYSDLCYTLACKNVVTERHPIDEKLNRSRIKAGRSPLPDFHILKLKTGEMAGTSGGSGAHGSPRAHLRRGHIRRLGPERITWVNSTMVRGHGFVDKAYAVQPSASR